nr:hypothetical protein [Tanacetum cinerariifolium]
MQTKDDLRVDELLYYEAEIEEMNLILISIPNDIYNSVDACTTAIAMWERVERLMRGTVLNKVDRKTHFNNEFDQFVAEPGEALVLFEKLVNASRAKKLEKAHNPLALVAHTGSSSRNTTSYYVIHPPSLVDYDEDYQKDVIQTNFEDLLTFAMLLLALLKMITVHDSYALEKLPRNAYKEAEKQQILAKKVQQQTTMLTSQLELYKEKVRVIEKTKGDTKIFNEYIEADRKARRLDQEAQSQFIRDRDIIRDLEQKRDKLDLAVIELKRKNEELQKTQTILKQKMSENKDSYNDTILDLGAKIKKNVDMIDTEDILDVASKSQTKMKEKMNDPIAIEKKQKCWTIDYKKLNALYKDFVPQKELSAERKYFSPSFISSEKSTNATSFEKASMPSENPLLVDE